MKEYYLLTKPGIIRGNLLTSSGGFLLASYGNVDIALFISMLLGTALVVASGCVFNNFIDRRIDSVMARTKKRALVTGKISPKNALVFGAGLFIGGLIVLYLFVNTLAALVALVGFIFYVAIYGYWKRKSVYGTLVGSVSGAVPPVIGYTAVTGVLDLGAFLLFLILVVWQMPHFYAIGIYGKEDYKKSSIPVLPVVKGILATKIHIIFYIIAFIIFSSLLTFFGYTGIFYLFVLMTIGIIWLYKGALGFRARDDELWARRMFAFSLIVILIFCVMISIDFALPF